jgi:hypothetical protein
VVAQDVCGGDGEKQGEQEWMDGADLDAAGVEVEGQEADGDVQDFAGDFVAVYLDVAVSTS